MVDWRGEGRAQTQDTVEENQSEVTGGGAKGSARVG